MFRTLRHFSLLVFLAMLVTAILLLLVFQQTAMTSLREEAQRQNMELARSFGNSLWPRFAAFAASHPTVAGEELRRNPEIAELAQAVRAQMLGTSVLKVKLYSAGGLVLYSTDPEQIGDDNSANPRFRKALAGETVARFRDHPGFRLFGRIVGGENILSCYIPIRDGPAGPVKAVFELYTDIGPSLKRLRTALWEMAAAIAAAMLLLYGVLFLIIKRVETPVEKADGTERQKTLAGTVPLAVLSGFLAVLFFLFDISIPLGVAAGIPYVALVLVGLWFAGGRAVLVLAVLASLLSILGYFYSAPAGIPWMVLANRGLALFAIWVTAVLGFLHKRHEIELEVRVQERTRELSNEIEERKRAEESLRRALLEAEAANRARSEFLANINHELLTPLTAVIGFSESIRQETFGPLGHAKYTDYVESIGVSGRHLLEIITDVFDISAIETGRMQLSEEKVSLAEAAEAAARLVRSRAIEGRVRLSTAIDASLPAIFADNRKVKQILFNLLSNAVKFTPEGGEVLLAARLGDDGSMIVTVTDSGAGMDEEAVVRALLMFGRADSMVAAEDEGPGLGLPLAKSLVEAHGGILEIESEPGAGTTVILRFPVERIIPENRPRTIPDAGL